MIYIFIVHAAEDHNLCLLLLFLVRTAPSDCGILPGQKPNGEPEEEEESDIKQIHCYKCPGTEKLDSGIPHKVNKFL